MCDYFEDDFDNDDFMDEDTEMDDSLDGDSDLDGEPDDAESKDDFTAKDAFIIGGIFGIGYEEGLRERTRKKRKRFRGDDSNQKIGPDRPTDLYRQGGLDDTFSYKL